MWRAWNCYSYNKKKQGKLEVSFSWTHQRADLWANGHPKLWRVRYRKRQTAPEIGLPGTEAFGIYKMVGKVKWLFWRIAGAECRLTYEWKNPSCCSHRWVPHSFSLWLQEPPWVIPVSLWEKCPSGRGLEEGCYSHHGNLLRLFSLQTLVSRGNELARGQFWKLITGKGREFHPSFNFLVSPREKANKQTNKKNTNKKSFKTK